jgi:hypothetical protein
VPGSVNSNGGNQVKIISEWNGQRPAINYLLNDFRKYLIQKDIDRYHDYELHKKNFKHSLKLKLKSQFRPNNNSSRCSSIGWIESNILQGNGISDHRKLTIDLILARYLLNIKNYSYETAYNTIIEWLDKCASKRPLDFNVDYRASHALNNAIRSSQISYETRYNESN